MNILSDEIIMGCMLACLFYFCVERQLATISLGGALISQHFPRRCSNLPPLPQEAR